MDCIAVYRLVRYVLNFSACFNVEWLIMYEVLHSGQLLLVARCQNVCFDTNWSGVPLSSYFMITAEILTCSLANFHRQWGDRHMNLEFYAVCQQARAYILTICYRKKKTSVCHTSLLLLTKNVFITLSKYSADPLRDRIVSGSTATLIMLWQN